MTDFPPASPAAFPLADALDRQIAALLAADARVSFRRIAAELGVTEGTVRGRMKRLQGSGLLKLMPVIDMDTARKGQMMFLSVTCEPGMMKPACDGLLALDAVKCLYDVNTGNHLTAICMLADLAEAAATVNAATALPGVIAVESDLVLATIKYNAAIAPIATVEDTLLAASGVALP